MAALRAADLHRPRAGLVAFAHHEHGVALRRARHRLLRQQHGAGLLGLGQPHPHVLAGQQQALGIGQLGTHGHLPRAGVDAEVAEEQPARLGQQAAVFQHHAHRHRLTGQTAQLARRHGLAQGQQLTAALREVDVDAVDLLHQRQGRGLGGTGERAFGHQRAADAAGDRRFDARHLEVDASRLHRGLAGRDIGLGHLLRRQGVGVVLLAERLRRGQRLVTLGGGLGLGQIGAGAGQLRAGGVQRRLVGRGVDQEQGLAGLDFAALAELALQHDAVDAGSHLGHAQRLHPARQLALQGHHLGLDRDHADLRRWRACGRAGGVLGAAGRQHQAAQGKRGGDAE